jgi:alcohol dehydrogenase
MKALHYDGELRLIADAPLPKRREGEVLVRVRMAGICSTDLEIIKGYMGFYGFPGHEFVGEVEEADDPAWIGRRVVGEINCPCGSCLTCASGRSNHCPNRTVLGILGKDGAYAEYLTLPVKNLYELPDAIGDESGTFVEPVAAAFEILKQTRISPQDRVVVVGDGRLGLLVSQVLKRTGVALTVIGRHEEKLGIVRKLGIDTVLEDESGSLQSADMVVDCSGSPEGFLRSRSLVRPGGRLVVKSTFASSVQMDLSSLVVDEITLIGSRCGPFPPAISALADKEVEVLSLISAVYPLEEGIEAFRKASEPDTLKVLLKMS